MYTVRPIKVPGRLGRRWAYPPLAAGAVSLLVYFGPGLIMWPVRQEGNILLAAFVAPLVLAGLHYWILRRSIKRPFYYLLYCLSLWLMSGLVILWIDHSARICIQAEPHIHSGCEQIPVMSIGRSDIQEAILPLALGCIVLASYCGLRGNLLSLALHRPWALVKHRAGRNLLAEFLAIIIVLVLAGIRDSGDLFPALAWLAYWLISGGATGRDVERWVARETRRGERRLHVMRVSRRGFRNFLKATRFQAPQPQGVQKLHES